MKYTVLIHFYGCRLFEETVTATSSESAVLKVIGSSMDYNLTCVEKFGHKMNDTIVKIEVEIVN